MAANRTAVLAVLVGAAFLVLGVTAPGTAHPGNTGPSGDTSATARTDAGLVSGTRTATHTVYQGIPYAGPPTGTHRWAAPRPVSPWTGVRDATKPGPLCPQVASAYAGVSSLNAA